MSTFLLTFVVFAVAISGLAVGVLLTRDKELQGSCGGPSLNDDCCMTCPDKPACDEAASLDLEIPPVERREPPAALAQAPSASPDDGPPVAAPR